MGLDSVELIMEVEKYFSISIPDDKAEKICTIDDFVNHVYNGSATNIADNEFKKSILVKIQIALNESNLTQQLELEDKCATFLLQLTNKDYQSLQEKLGLKLPVGFNQGAVSYFFTSASIEQRLAELKVSAFIDALLIVNYKNALISERQLSRYIVYIKIGGIVSEKLGIDPIEIEPQKHFVRDYGID
jgi:acyl carrier protein